MHVEFKSSLQGGNLSLVGVMHIVGDYTAIMTGTVTTVFLVFD